MIKRLKIERKRVRYLHRDNEAGLGSYFRQMLKLKIIQLETKVPYTPEQNGFAESPGNRICVVARALRIQAGFSKDLWPELVHTEVCLLNRMPNLGLRWKTPFEMYNGHKPDISYLKIIGCRAQVHIPKEKRIASEKLSERAWIG